METTHKGLILIRLRLDKTVKLMYNILLNNEGVKHGKKSSNRKPPIQSTNHNNRQADIATAFASLVIHFDNPSADGPIYQVNAMSIR